jgi:L-fuconolactonase
LQEIIDTHNHLWQYEDNEFFSWIQEGMDVLRQDFSINQLEQTLQANGVAGSLLVHAVARLDESKVLLALAEKHNMVRGVVGWCDIVAGAETVKAQIQELRACGNKLKGIRYLSQGLPPEHLLSDSFVEGVREVGRAGLVYELLVTTEQLDAAAELVKQVEETNFILEHIAKPPIKAREIHPWAEKINGLAASPRVACKISGMVTEADWQQWKPADFVPYLDTVYEAFGQERLIFGSDWPMLLVATDYGGVKGIITAWVATHKEIDSDKIFADNARRIYHLD